MQEQHLPPLPRSPYESERER
jgi:hypothetical protein